MRNRHSSVPWVVTTSEKSWNLANPCWLIFQRWRNDQEILPRSWLTSGNLLCGSARATSPMSIWSEQTTGSCAPAVSDKSTTIVRGEQSPRHHRSRSLRHSSCSSRRVNRARRKTRKRTHHLTQSRTKIQKCTGKRWRQVSVRAHTKMRSAEKHTKLPT